MPKFDKAKVKGEFLRRISAGESHSQICKDKHMPDWATVWRWAKQDSEFAADIEECKFERGCKYGYLVGEIGLDLYNNADKQTHEMVAAKRAAADMLKWSAARMAGKNGWGDKVQVEHDASTSYVDALKAINERVEQPIGLQELRAREADKPKNKSIH